MGMTQTQFGSLVNAHFVTVSRWENGTMIPDKFQESMLEQFTAIEERRRQKVGDAVKGALIGAGIALAVFLLLKAAQQSKG